MSAKPKKNVSGDKTDNLTFLITYLLEWLTGLIVYFTVGQNDKRARFHAIQAIVLGIVSIILSFILDFVFLPLSGIVAFLIWLYGMYIGYEAYKGVDVKIPILSDYLK